MTDDVRPPDELDELASAVLDGEATPADLARVEADPAVAARVEELRRIRSAIAAPVPPPASEAREAAVAAALAAAGPDVSAAAAGGAAVDGGSTEVDGHGTNVGGPGTVATPPPPTPITRPAAPRNRWLLPVAAAVVAALAIGAIVATRGGPDKSTADASRETSAARGAAPSTLTAADAAGATTTASGPASTVVAAGTTAASGGAPAPPTADAGVSDLGPVDGADQLRNALAAVSSPAIDQSATGSCPVPAPGTRLVAVARWRGQDALVFASSAPPARAVVLAATGCELLAEVPLG